MPWTGVIWREAGISEPDGPFVQQVRLGHYTFASSPEVGCQLEINGAKYLVSSVAGRFCHVRGGPARVKEEVPRGEDTGSGSFEGSRPMRWRAADAMLAAIRDDDTSDEPEGERGV
jgi:hypothetical protein